MASTPSQFEWHRKPAGWSGAPCPICGCPTPRLRANHRATTFDERKQSGLEYLWVKVVRICFGTDWAYKGLE